MRIAASVNIDRPASQVWAYVADYGNDSSRRGGVDADSGGAPTKEPTI